MNQSEAQVASTWLGNDLNPENLLSALALRSAGWLSATGPESDIIISTRIRLARNLAGIPFTSKANRAQLESTQEKVLVALEHTQILQNALVLHMDELDALNKRMLMERRLISPNFAETERPAGLVVGEDEAISLMINEEDHLRLQAIKSGLQTRETFKQVEALDDEIGDHLKYAFSDHFGYLTSCPTNTGTGMRVSVFIHLPALSMAGKIEQVIREFIPSEIAIRGFYGEGSEVMGHIFQVSNQLTLGRTERRILDRLEQVAKKFVEMEREARQELMQKQRLRVEDKVFRAKAILQSALLVGSAELVNLLSAIRLGINLGIIDNIAYKPLNDLLVLTQSAHIQINCGKEMDSQQRDEIRAEIVRNLLIVNVYKLCRRD